MTATQRFHLQIALTGAPVVALAAANWYLRPQHALVWSTAIALMAGNWLVVGLLERSTRSQRKTLANAVSVAGLIVGASLALTLAIGLGYVASDDASRAGGVVTGLLLAVFGNSLPKVVTPLVAGRCSPAQTQAINRFAGWILTLAGLAYVLVWTLAPSRWATPLSFLIGVLLLILTLGRVALARRGVAP